MELEVKTRRLQKNNLVPAMGFISFLIGLFALAGLNTALLLKIDEFPDFILFRLPLFGLVLGGIGLFTRKKSRLFAWWGIGLNIFMYVFLFLMIIFSLSINYKP